MPYAAQAELAPAAPGEDGFIVLRAMEARSPILGADKEPLPVWGLYIEAPFGAKVRMPYFPGASRTAHVQ